MPLKSSFPICITLISFSFSMFFVFIVSPGNDGVPDRLVVMPGGHIGFVEVKAPGKKPTPLQHVRMRELLSLGCGVWVLDSLEGIDGVVAAVCQTSACEGPHLGGAEGKA